MIRYVVTGHRASTSGDFKLDDIAGGAGRLDVLVRCVNSVFFLSHSIRQDAELYLVLMGGEDAPKTIRLVGNELRYLNPDERSTSSLIRNALLKKIGSDEVSSSPGIYVSRMSFKDVIDAVSKTSEIAYLKEDGEDIRKIKFKENVTFVLGDDKDLTENEESIVMEHSPKKVCLGPRSLHADHCIILVNNEADRRT